MKTYYKSSVAEKKLTINPSDIFEPPQKQDNNTFSAGFSTSSSLPRAKTICISASHKRNQQTNI